jgi:hypothetical protein
MKKTFNNIDDLNKIKIKKDGLYSWKGKSKDKYGCEFFYTCYQEIWLTYTDGIWTYEDKRIYDYDNRFQADSLDGLKQFLNNL